MVKEKEPTFIEFLEMLFNKPWKVMLIVLIIVQLSYGGSLLNFSFIMITLTICGSWFFIDRVERGFTKKDDLRP